MNILSDHSMYLFKSHLKVNFDIMIFHLKYFNFCL